VSDAATDAASDDAAETGAAADDGATEGTPTRSRRATWVPWATAGVLFVFAVVLAVVAASLQGQLSAERDDRREVERVAGELTAALLTYDHRDLEGWRARVLAHSTGSFRRTFEDTYKASLEPIVTEAQASSTGTVKDIFLGEIDNGSATAIVVASTVAEGNAGRRRGFDTYVQLDLVEVDGRWRVNDVTNLNLGGSESAGDGNAAP